MVLEHSNYREYLKNELAARQSKNKSYSMRSFATQLGLTQSAISQVFAGKRNLSPESATRIGQKLGLSEFENEYLRTLVQIETTKNPDFKQMLLARAQALNPKREIKDLSMDLFRVIADWYHLPIKNMIGLDKFVFNAGNISKRLGISKIEADMAIQRLVHLEMIEMDPEHPDQYRVVTAYALATSRVPNEALRRFHKQMLEKAMESLETQTPQEKIVGSETFAISDKLLPKANQITEEYFQKMSQLSRESVKPNQVYHLGVQFFNLTKERK